MKGRFTTKVRTLLTISSAVLPVAWPFIIWASIEHGLSLWSAGLLIIFLLLRLWLVKDKPGRQRTTQSALALAGILLCVASLLLRNHQMLMYYPVVVNGVLLVLFGSSLYYGMPIVEQIARLTEPELPPQGVRYTRQVTRVWCGFFIFNGTISLITCLYNDMKIWTLWNGGISYLLIGLLMGTEWLVRQRVKAQ